MNRFLFAADFSNANENAFNYTINLVKDTMIKIDMIHVFDVPIAYTTQTQPRAVKGYVSELRDAAYRRMKEWQERLDPANRGDLTAVQGIYPSTEIHSLAEKNQSDLIIMSLRKDYGILKRMIGNTTANTIYKSSIPVMAIPAKANYQKISEIVFPTIMAKSGALSERERAAINWLQNFSGFLDSASIELIHIIEDRSTTDVDITFTKEEVDPVRWTQSHSLTVEEGILSFIEKKQAHLLAFYRPNRNFWERLYRPSKTRQLLYDSSIPLIVFG